MKHLLSSLTVSLLAVPICAAAQPEVSWEDLLVLPDQSEVRLVVRGGVPVEGRIIKVTLDAIELRSRPLHLNVPQDVQSNGDRTVWRFPRDYVVNSSVIKVAPYTTAVGATIPEISRVVRAIGTGTRVEVRTRTDQSCRGRIRHINDTSFGVDCRNKALQKIAFGDLAAVRTLGIHGAIQGAVIGAAIFWALIWVGYEASKE